MFNFIDMWILNKVQELIIFLNKRGINTGTVFKHLSLLEGVGAGIYSLFDFLHSWGSHGAAISLFTTAALVGFSFILFTIPTYRFYERIESSPTRRELPPFAPTSRLVCLFFFVFFSILNIRKGMEIFLINGFSFVAVLLLLYGLFCIHLPPTRKQKQKKTNLSLVPSYG